MSNLSSRPSPHSDVILRGVDIPFFDLVQLMVKAAFASIPAVLIIMFVCTVAVIVAAAVVRALFWGGASLQGIFS